MAGEIVISELLCFLRKNYDTQSVSQLKAVIVNFYSDDELMASKEILLKATMKAIEAASISVDLPRLPRRQGEKKGKQTTDDILKLMAVIDERDLFDALPRFVAEDISRIPYINADTSSLISMMRKMEAFEQRMIIVEQSVGKLSHSVSPDLPVPVRQAESTDTPDSCPNVPGTSTQVVNTDGDSSGSQWTTVVGRGVRNKASVQRSGNVESSNGRNSTAGSTARKIFGTKSDGNSTVTSGVPIIQKSVIHIDNLHFDCTKDLLNDYLLAADIKVLTCHPARSWLREGEKEQVTAFRVCVPASERCKVMNPQLWSEGVVLRDWKFKKNIHGR